MPAGQVCEKGLCGRRRGALNDSMRQFIPPCRRRPSPGRLLLAGLVALLLAPGPASALTLKDLLEEKDLTPKKFAARIPKTGPGGMLVHGVGGCDDCGGGWQSQAEGRTGLAVRPGAWD